MTKTELNKEYIEDRSIHDASEDSFRHEDVVDELADLALNGPAPSNIALFAPWGTGKSGIGKLLEPRVEKADQLFVYFDAFKHRETPLRRSFLRAAVGKLDPGSLESVDTKLYGERTIRTLNSSDKKRLFWLIVGGVLGALVIAGLVSFLLSKLHPGPFDEDFPGLFAKTSGVLALVGGLVGVALTSLVNGYSVTRTSTPVAEDDEFEREFNSLVEGSKRVVVFVDELDRCSADDVVEALETMRIFLETTNCVFVVAIDQQSLEQALRRKARQETPVDETHPYFSSAGSYIDKIFQYQVALPPLRSRDMEGFVRKLVADRPGLWKDLRDRDELQDVIGALAPTHVTSPRRIKVLLNSFVMAHHLAAKRIAAEEMSPLDDRAAALAKLVCLRTEFPLFAEELERFPQLPKAMLAQDRKAEDGLAAEAPDTWNRATAFLKGELPLVPLLFRPSAVNSVDGEDADVGEVEKTVKDQHLANLLGYLRRVESLPEITSDLVYLHSAAGSGTKLEPLTADRVEEAARDGSAERIGELLKDNKQAAGEVIGLLTSILTAAQPGSLDANNATHVLLAACGLTPKLDGARIADAADEIVRQRGGRQLEDRDLAGAVGLSVRVSARRRSALIDLVARNEDLLFTPAARVRLIAEFSSLESKGRSLAAEAVVRAIRDEQEDALAAVAELDGDVQSELMEAARPSLRSLWQQEVAVAKAEAAKAVEQQEGEAQPEVDPGDEVDGVWRPRLEAALDLFVERAPAAATQLASGVLALNRRDLSNVVGERLAALAPVEDRHLRRQALSKAGGRPLADRAAWMAPLAAGEMDGSTIAQLGGAAAATWRDVVDKGAEPGETLDGVLDQLERLAPTTSTSTAPLDKAIAESLQAEAIDDLGSERLQLAAATAKRLVGAGLADRGRAASLLAGAFSGALSVVPGGDPTGRPNLSRAFAEIAPQLGDAEEASLTLLLEEAQSSAAETLGALRVEAMVAAASALHEKDAEFDPALVQEAVVAQIESTPDGAIDATAAWIGSGVLLAVQLWALLRLYWSNEIPAKVRQAAMAAAQKLSEDERRELAGSAFDRVFSDGIPAPSNWEAIDLRGLPAGWVIDRLAERSKAEDFDESGWRVILEICKQLTSGVAEIQRRIGEELLVPLASRDDDGFRLAVDHLGLVGKGKTGQSVIEAFSRLATSEKRRQLLSRQLGEDQGLVRSLAKGLYKRIFGDPGSASGSDGPSDESDPRRAESGPEEAGDPPPPEDEDDGDPV
ncbi:MAG TPA: P-loop NTPase fold protein [Solirubrobacterales bacterium]|nr:P-loop NTPase fold protein [Solirubrobacterales bacterium]